MPLITLRALAKNTTPIGTKMMLKIREPTDCGAMSPKPTVVTVMTCTRRTTHLSHRAGRACRCACRCDADRKVQGGHEAVLVKVHVSSRADHHYHSHPAQRGQQLCRRQVAAFRRLGHLLLLLFFLLLQHHSHVCLLPSSFFCRRRNVIAARLLSPFFFSRRRNAGAAGYDAANTAGDTTRNLRS